MLCVRAQGFRREYGAWSQIQSRSLVFERAIGRIRKITNHRATATNTATTVAKGGAKDVLSWDGDVTEAVAVAANG